MPPTHSAATDELSTAEKRTALDEIDAELRAGRAALDKMNKLQSDALDFDLDAFRAAGGEDRKRAKHFRLAGVVYEVPSRLPLWAAFYFERGDLEGGLAEWLGAEQLEAFSKSGITDEEFGELFTNLYGAAPGESLRSGR